MIIKLLALLIREGLILITEKTTIVTEGITIIAEMKTTLRGARGVTGKTKDQRGRMK